MNGQGLGLRPDQYPLNDNAVASPTWRPPKKPATPEWPTLEEDVKWACEKVYKDSHK